MDRPARVGGVELGQRPLVLGLSLFSNILTVLQNFIIAPPKKIKPQNPDHL